MSAPQKLALQVKLPTADRRMAAYTLSTPRDFPAKQTQAFNRVAFAAAHVVADPLAAKDPWVEAAVDWDATIAFRRHLWGLGFGVAEAMDTAQRGMGLDWASSLELIRRSIEAARDVPGAVLASGAGTDQLEPGPKVTVADVIAAYEHQFEAVERAGGRIIMMASRALAACTKSPDDYYRVYTKLLQQAKEPVIIHWLGEMFDPALAGYWGYAGSPQGDGGRPDRDPGERLQGRRREGVAPRQAERDRHASAAAPRRGWGPLRPTQGCADVHRRRFQLRRADRGRREGHSDALLGIFDTIAPAASGALAALARGDRKSFHEILAPTVPLSRHIFGAPTRFYKTGVVFLAWLNGHQEHFVMVGGQQSARHILHLAEAFRLADRAGLLRDPELACRRMRQLLAVNGLEG